ncbi:hypothetical protein HDV00_001464, partial [Rhizophlyctis rosea]
MASDTCDSSYPQDVVETLASLKSHARRAAARTFAQIIRTRIKDANTKIRTPSESVKSRPTSASSTSSAAKDIPQTQSAKSINSVEDDGVDSSQPGEQNGHGHTSKASVPPVLDPIRKVLDQWKEYDDMDAVADEKKDEDKEANAKRTADTFIYKNRNLLVLEDDAERYREHSPTTEAAMTIVAMSGGPIPPSFRKRKPPECPVQTKLKKMRRRRERLGRLAWYAELALSGVELPTAEEVERRNGERGDLAVEGGDGVGDGDESGMEEEVTPCANLFDALIEAAKNASLSEAPNAEELNDTLIKLAHPPRVSSRKRRSSATAALESSNSSTPIPIVDDYAPSSGQASATVTPVQSPKLGRSHLKASKSAGGSKTPKPSTKLSSRVPGKGKPGTSRDETSPTSKLPTPPSPYHSRLAPHPPPAPVSAATLSKIVDAFGVAQPGGGISKDTSRSSLPLNPPYPPPNLGPSPNAIPFESPFSARRLLDQYNTTQERTSQALPSLNSVLQGAGSRLDPPYWRSQPPPPPPPPHDAAPHVPYKFYSALSDAAPNLGPAFPSTQGYGGERSMEPNRNAQSSDFLAGAGRNDRGNALPSIRDILGGGEEGRGGGGGGRGAFGGGYHGKGMVGEMYGGGGGLDGFGGKRGREDGGGR